MTKKITIIKKFQEKIKKLGNKQVTKNEVIFSSSICLVLILIFAYYTSGFKYMMISLVIIIFSILISKYSKSIEQILLKELSVLCFILIITLIFTIEGNEKHYLIGGVFAFWYGYKKYERDKELEVFQMGLGIKKDLNHDEIIEKWQDLIYMYDEGYVGKKLFEKIEQDYIHYIEHYIRNIVDSSAQQLKLAKLLFSLASREYFKKKLYFMKEGFKENKKLISKKPKNIISTTTLIDRKITYGELDEILDSSIENINIILNSNHF